MINISKIVQSACFTNLNADVNTSTYVINKRYLVGYANFAVYMYRYTDTQMSLVIFGVTEPKLTNFLNDVERSSPLLISPL